MSLAGHVVYMEDVRSARNILVMQPGKKSFPVRCRCRWEDSSKMDLTEIECEGMGWIHHVQERVHCWAFVNKQKAGYSLTN
jgi:hypothetical protein